MANQPKEVTFSLPGDVIDALDEAVSAGAAPDKNVFVEQALLRELREHRRRIRRVRWETAMQDPLFLKDISDVEQDFLHSLREHLDLD